MASGSIHYKFKSAKTFDTLTFDGSFVAVGELKKLIAEKKGLGKDRACELVVENAQDQSEYNDESALVWKNTSVIVRRVPIAKASAVGSAIGADVVKKVVYVAPPDVSMIPSKSVARRLQMNLNKITAGDSGKGSLGGEGGNGDDALASMAREQTQRWESEKQAANAASGGRGRGGGRGAGRGTRPDGPPGPGYICFKCNQGGHWIQDCPLAADTTVEIVRTKHAYGIPQTKLEATTGGILVAPTGESTQLVAAEDEFNKMFGFLKERGKETLALGNGEEEPLALGNGEVSEAEARQSEAPSAAPSLPPLPPGFMPPLPPGAPPPNARKAEAPMPTMTPMMMNPMMMNPMMSGALDPMDPMGIMSMDTSLEGLKKMAEELKRQQDILAAGGNLNMMMIPGLMDLPVIPAAPPLSKPLPPMPAAPPPPPSIRASGPPVFDEDEDTVLTLAQDDEPIPEPESEEEEEREEDEDNPRRRATERATAEPEPAPAAARRPPPPPSHIPEDIQKQHDEAMKSSAQQQDTSVEDDAKRRSASRGGRGQNRSGRDNSRDRPNRSAPPPPPARGEQQERFGANASARANQPRRAIRPGERRGARSESREPRSGRRGDSRDRPRRGDSRDRVSAAKRKRKFDGDGATATTAAAADADASALGRNPDDSSAPAPSSAEGGTKRSRVDDDNGVRPLRRSRGGRNRGGRNRGANRPAQGARPGAAPVFNRVG